MAINEKLNAGETVGAVLTNVKTGKKTVVGGAPSPKKEPRYRVEVKVTDLETGEIHRYEATRS